MRDAENDENDGSVQHDRSWIIGLSRERHFDDSFTTQWIIQSAIDEFGALILKESCCGNCPLIDSIRNA